MTTNHHTPGEWLAVTRYWSFAVSAMPVIVTFAYLLSRGLVPSGIAPVINFALALVGVIVLHAAGNVLSDAADYKSGVDNKQAYAVRNLVFGHFKVREYVIFSILLFVLGCLIGLVLCLRSGFGLLLIGGAGVLLTIAYSFLKYHALGDLDIFVIFSVLIILGTTYVVCGAVYYDALVLALPVGIITVSVLHANNTLDIDSDSAAGIRTFAMLIGGKASCRLYQIYMILPFVCVVGAVIAGRLHPLSLVCLAAVIPALANIRGASHYDKLGIKTMAGLDQASAKLQTVFSGLLSISLFISAACMPAHTAHRPCIDLGGNWQTPLGACRLPGSTDQSRLGSATADTTQTSKLTRLFPYWGKLRYERDITIPAALAGKTLMLTMERTKPSTLTVDGVQLGHLTHIYAPHKYLIGPLSKGIHHFAIDIDNTLDEVPDCLPNGHGYSENTQTNWNGILGEFRLEALPDPWIEDIQIYPDVASHTAVIKLKVISSKDTKIKVRTVIESFNTDIRQSRRPDTKTVELVEGANIIEQSADMGEDQLLWSEFHPALYKATVNIGKDRISANFGMKDLRVVDKRLTLNGKKVFLRGTHDALVFPLTGYPPMDEESWMKYFSIAKEYGLNHVRFHSCAPPKAAFDAADKMGFIMQAELPMWGEIDPADTKVNEFMKREGRMLLDYVGNSPSLGFLGLGNELRGSVPEMQKWLEEFRQQDSRHLYDFGSNNFLGYHGQPGGEDILITCRTKRPDGNFAVLRSSFSFSDEDDGGPINACKPRTDRDFGEIVAQAGRPIMGHETGQFQFYPDYAQIEKYTGVLYPYNLKIFRQRLIDGGLGSQAEEFARESGAFSIECYKEDVEWFLRTPGMAGFEMLDLKDYPGQGTALVGILDAFMDSKGAITPQAWRGFCSSVVPMARFDGFCRRTSEPLEMDFVIANYTEDVWNDSLCWSITDGNGWSKEGQSAASIPQGEVAAAAKVSVDLSGIKSPSALKLTVSTGNNVNSYNLWAYPEANPYSDGITVSRVLTPEVEAILSKGGKVLLRPSFSQIEGISVGGLFTPDYWNYSMFKSISEGNHRPVSPGTLGILPDSSSPLYKEFPTEGHSDWQWWSIARNSRPIILDGLDGCRPVLQVMDNMERCHRLGILTEFKVGEGSLMLCTCDLDAIAGTAEGAQFSAAIYDYIRSDAFRPTYEITAERLKAILSGKVTDWKASAVDTAADYSK